MYHEVLSFSDSQSADGINWASVFEDQSLFKQIYKQEIIVALMEASKIEDANKRVIFVSQSIMGSSSTTRATVDQSGGAAAFDDDEEEEMTATSTQVNTGEEAN